MKNRGCDKIAKKIRKERDKLGLHSDDSGMDNGHPKTAHNTTCYEDNPSQVDPRTIKHNPKSFSEVGSMIMTVNDKTFY